MLGLSTAERMAMQLDGDLVALGDGATHLDRVVSSSDRAASLGIAFKPQHIVCGLAAAWIHGCAAEPRVIDVACLRHRRAEPPADPRCRGTIRAVSLRDCVLLGGVAVTSKRRTAIDLLADLEWNTTRTIAVQMLLDGTDRADIRRRIAVAGRAGRHRMLMRLADVPGDDVALSVSPR